MFRLLGRENGARERFIISVVLTFSSPSGISLLAMSARPFTETEYLTLDHHFAAAGRTRDRLLLVLGSNTGLRISELLGLTHADVAAGPGNEMRRELIVAVRRRLKGGKGMRRRSVTGRRIVLGEAVRQAIREHLEKTGPMDPSTCLFQSRQSGSFAMSRWQAHRLLVEACRHCGIETTRISNHSYRKYFCTGLFKATKDLLLVQACVGHSSPLTTARYIMVNKSSVDQAILNLSATAPAGPTNVIPMVAA